MTEGTDAGDERRERSQPESVLSPDPRFPLATVEPDRVTQAGRCGVPARWAGPVPRRTR